MNKLMFILNKLMTHINKVVNYRINIAVINTILFKTFLLNSVCFLSKWTNFHYHQFERKVNGKEWVYLSCCYSLWGNFAWHFDNADIFTEFGNMVLLTPKQGSLHFLTPFGQNISASSLSIKWHWTLD